MNPNKRERVKPSVKYQVMAEQGLPAATLRGVASYYADLNEAAGPQVCVGTSCLLASEQADCEIADCRGVYCLGYCDRSPAWLDAEGHLQHGAGGLDIRSHARCPVVTRRLGNGGTSSLRHARELGAYETLATALAGEPAAVLAAMERSGERGRGGAAFPTFLKWQSCAGTAAESRYVIANGDEGDPGSFIDRVLMENDPHGILEGLMLCGFAVGAREGIVFIRSEYPRAIAVMEEAIRELRKAELIGRDILSSGFDFEISVAAGMGSYVCGEETALINALEGRRGEVSIRPPYPTQSGLHGLPTVIQNVETLVNVPFIVADGGASYAALGSGDSTGTKALCLNHGFARPGIVEVEFGISLREVIEELGGGGKGGKPLAAVLLGGPMGSVLTPEEWDVPVCYDAMAKRGVELGHGGLVAVPQDTDFRRLLEHWLDFMIHESCGKCVPCRLGAQCASNALRATSTEAETRRRLDELFTAMEQGSLCAFGRSMPRPMRQLIDHFGGRIFQPSNPI